MHAVAGPGQPAILVVDDELYVRDILARWLEEAGFACTSAGSSEEALAEMARREISLVTLDIALSGQSGLALLNRINEQYPDTAVIMLSGDSRAECVIESLTGGACAYLIKPVVREELLLQVGRGLERRSLILDNRSYTQHLERRVREQTLDLRRGCEETIYRLVSACSYRNLETGSHVRRTGLLSEVLARAAGWGSSEAEQLLLAAPMHDIGKIGIPDAILQKPGRLTSEEFEVMKQHTVIGAEILADSELSVLQLAQTIALCHHEKWNGRGYPAGLAGHDIPHAARIVAIVDVYDALTHGRIYRPSLSEAETLAVMIEKSGSHFDPELLELFLSLLPEMRQICRANPDALDARSLARASRHSAGNTPGGEVRAAAETATGGW